jgi:16S rRNA (guanine527-N7)-methyltransferase
MTQALWNDLASRANLTLDDAQHALLQRYLDLLLEANHRVNLTRITNREAAKLLHIADALTLLPHLPGGPIRIADVGTGGGIPGIPIAIARDDTRVTLIESTKKKAAILREIIASLNLPNVEVLDQRAEDVGLGPLRESFDAGVARAVAEMVWLAEWCLPLVRKGGRVLAMKGQRIAEELPPAMRAIKLLGGGEPGIRPAHLPGTEHHVIVEIPKLAKTDKRYPRPATSAKGKPMS